jgi:hypothetical protein
VSILVDIFCFHHFSECTLFIVVFSTPFCFSTVSCLVCVLSSLDELKSAIKKKEHTGGPAAVAAAAASKKHEASSDKPFCLVRATNGRDVKISTHV